MREEFKFEFNKIYRSIPDEFKVSIYATFPVPTEIVIDKSGFYEVGKGRIYYTNLYLWGGEIMEYSKVEKQEGFCGTGLCEEILLVEVWEDEGDDGHTQYRWVGYAITTSGYLGKMDNICLGALRMVWKDAEV